MKSQLPIFAPLPEDDVQAFYEKHSHGDAIPVFIPRSPTQLRHQINVALSVDGTTCFQATVSELETADTTVADLEKFAWQDGWIVEVIEFEGQLDRVRIAANRGIR